MEVFRQVNKLTIGTHYLGGGIVVALDIERGEKWLHNELEVCLGEFNVAQ